jgi:phage tail sheath protein FI
LLKLRGDEPTQSQLIIGGTQADGSYTGMFAFLTAEQKTGYRPRILGIPSTTPPK